MANRTDIIQDSFEIDLTKTDEENEKEFSQWVTAQKLLRGIPKELHNTVYQNERN